jgi:vacuolar-type H+-ATPase subunit I/STV1
MKRNNRIFLGVILILAGALLLSRELWPELFQFWDWPFFIIGLGGFFLLWAVFSGAGGLAVPGSILAGIGGILYYQNLTGDWESWAYIWALIPAFVGVGVILSGIIDRNYKEAFTGGLILLMISGILFFAFGEFFGLRTEVTQYWPVLLIILGVIALVRALLPGKGKRA